MITALWRLVNNKVLAASETRTIDDETVKRWRNARFRVRTVVPLMEKPVENIRVLTHDELEDFLDGYDEFAEFIVSIEAMDT